MSTCEEFRLCELDFAVFLQRTAGTLTAALFMLRRGWSLSAALYLLAKR